MVPICLWKARLESSLSSSYTNSRYVCPISIFPAWEYQLEGQHLDNLYNEILLQLSLPNAKKASTKTKPMTKHKNHPKQDTAEANAEWFGWNGETSIPHFHLFFGKKWPRIIQKKHTPLW